MNLTQSRSATLAAFALILIVLCVVAWQDGPDANWDLRNYHLYNGFAILNGRFGRDLAPAQMQTFHPPGLDVVYFWLRERLNERPALLNSILTLPHAIATFLAFLIARRILPWRMPMRTVVVLLAVVLGASGAAGLPTLATTMSEMIPASLVLGGLLLLLDVVESRAPSIWRVLGAATLLGAAVGVKLTAASYCISAGLALLLCHAAPPGRRILDLLLLGCGVAVAVILVAGPWWLTLYRGFGSPLFPYFNGLFRSPFAAPVNFNDARFLPRTVAQALFYPFYWAIRPQTLVIELPTRDPRFLLAYVSLVTTAIQGLVPRWRPDRKSAFLAIFFASSFAIWEAQFSILRYLAPLELLCGAVLLPPLLKLVSGRWWLLLPALAGICCIVIPLTVYPDWGRAEPRDEAVAVQVPPLPKSSLVILLDSSPMAYVAAFASPDARFVGANNTIIQPGSRTELAKQTETAIRSHAGPLWGLEIPEDSTGLADATLAYYGLRRGPSCRQIRSNLDHNAIRLCPLLREPG